MKKLTLLLLLSTALIISCGKEPEPEPVPDPINYPEMILGNWNLDIESTYMIRGYTSAEGAYKADTIPLSGGDYQIAYLFQNDTLVMTTITGGDSSQRVYPYTLAENRITFNNLEHTITQCTETHMALENYEDHDYRSGEHLKYTTHYQLVR